MSRLSIAFCVALALLVGAMWWSHANTERLIAAEGERLAERSAAVRESARHVERMLMWTRGAALGVLLLVFLGLRGEIRRRQAAETAMGAAEERLRLAVEGADLGILHWDLRTGAITWSERGLEFFGLEETGPLQREKFLPLIHPDDVPRVDGARARVLAGNPEYDVEFRICRPDGSIRWLAVSGRAVADAEGRPAVIQGVGRDVTARRQAEDDVRALAAQVATSNAELLAANRELERSRTRCRTTCGPPCEASTVSASRWRRTRGRG